MRNRTQQGLGREPAHRMVKWIFDDEHGLLSSMDCRQDFVDLTSFILKPGAAASSHVEPTPVRIPRGALAASQATIGSQPGALLAPSQVRWLPARCVVGSLPGSLSLSPSLSLYLIFHTRTYS